MRLKMILPGDTREVETDMEVFSLANIKSKQVLTAKVTMYVCFNNKMRSDVPRVLQQMSCTPLPKGTTV